MTDNEKRAHNLAISYTQYKKILEFIDEDSLKIVDLEADYYSEYELAYANFLDLLENQ